MSIQSTHNNIDNSVKPVDNSGDTSVDIKPFDVKKLKSPQLAVNSGGGEKKVLPAEQKHRPLTGKEKAFADYLIEHPTATQAMAIDHAYDTDGMADKTKRNMASVIKNKAPVMAYLEKHGMVAQRVLTEVMTYSNEYGKSGTKEGAMYATVAERTANSVLDRIHGKSKQTLDITSKSVSISVNLGM